MLANAVIGIDLSEWAGKANSAKALRAATDAIMGEVTALVAQLRDETPPAVPFAMNQSSVTGRGSTPQAQPAVAPGDAQPEGTGQ